MFVKSWPVLCTMDNDTSPLADSEVHYIHSAAVNDEFKIFVGHCGSQVNVGVDVDADVDADVGAVQLYVLDANGFFGAAVDIIRSLQLDAHLPPMVVIGIGYRLGGLGDTVTIRARDLTPTYDPWFVEIFPEQTRLGGAPALLRFIADELMPWVSSRYAVRADQAMLFGHSLGGLFATYTLLTAPSTFSRYGISSPSLWWHDEFAFTLEEQYAAAHADLAARVVVAVGEYETHDGRQREVERLPADQRALSALRQIDMVESADRLVARLRSRNYPNLSVDSIQFAGEFHISVGFLSLSRALRMLFDAPL